MRADLISSLKRLVDHTEEIFLALGDQFPALAREMNTSLERSRRLVDCFHGTRTSGCESEAELSGVIAATREIIEEGSAEFSRMHRRDQELFAQLDAGIKRLSSLEEMISNIKEDSVEMELISLNAMTVALKAGSAGRAFSYITEELKRLSAETISLTERITEKGGALLENFYTFRSAIQEVRTFQERLFGEFRTRLDTSFEDFKRGVAEVVSALESIRSRSEAVRQPVSRIVEAVQLQDIIKQSTDHVIISLEELKDVEETEDEDHLLDELSFFKILPDLCSVLLDDIKEKIAESLTLFRNQAKEAEGVITDTEARREEFVSSILSTESESETSLARLFSHSAEMLKSLLNDLDRSMQMKQSIAASGSALMKDVRQLEDNFKSFAALITRFHSIDVASRIEVAKQQVLQRMSGTVEQMTLLTRKIEGDVSVSLDSTKAFIANTASTITSVQETFREEEEFGQLFGTRIRDSFDRLFEARRKLTDSISGFSLFTRGFFGLFETTRGNLGRLELLMEDIETIKHELASIKANAENRMQPILRSREIESWEIGSERLKNIIERFTIFTHKKSAGELVGFDVEDGAHQGEFTLF